MKGKILIIAILTMMLTMSMAFAEIQTADSVTNPDGQWTNIAQGSDGDHSTSAVFPNPQTGGEERIVFEFTGDTAFFTGASYIINGSIFASDFPDAIVDLDCFDGSSWLNIASLREGNGAFLYTLNVGSNIGDSICLASADTNNYMRFGIQHGEPSGGVNIYEFQLDNPNFVSNTEPVINSIIPATRVELRNGEIQLFSLDVTDSDGDASYQWVLGGTTVSTSSTYTADWDNIEAGIYTLTAYVSDAEYNNSISTTLEIRALGGSPSGGASPITTTTDSQSESDTDFSLSVAGETSGSDRTFGEVISDFFSRIGSFFRNLF